MAAKSSYGKIAEEKMTKAFHHLEDEVKKIRTGRATPALFEDIRVEYWGAPTPLSQMATITVGEERVVTISPFDKSTLTKIEKAINTSDLGLHATNDGNIVRVAFPSPTGEDRKKWVKHIKEYVEEAKIAMRNIRRDDLKKVADDKKDGKLPEDDAKKVEEEIQKILKEHEEKCEQLFAKKEKEIMEG